MSEQAGAPFIRLSLRELLIDLEGLATPDGDYLDAEVVFDLEGAGSTQRALHATVKQAAGSRFSDPLEVLWPRGLQGRMPYSGYRDCVERYVRERVAAAVAPLLRTNPRGVTVEHLSLLGESVCIVSPG